MKFLSDIFLKMHVYFVSENAGFFEREMNEKRLRTELNEDFVGNVTKYIRKVASNAKTRIYTDYCGRFFKLEKFNTLTYKIMELMKIYDIKTRRYSTCVYRNRTYFMFESYPKSERYVRTANFTIFDFDNSLLVLFMWVFCLKCRYIIREMGITEIFPCEVYGINPEASEFTKIDIKRFLRCEKSVRIKIFECLTCPKKVSKISEILDNRYWYIEVKKRIAIIS